MPFRFSLHKIVGISAQLKRLVTIVLLSKIDILSLIGGVPFVVKCANPWRIFFVFLIARHCCKNFWAEVIRKLDTQPRS